MKIQRVMIQRQQQRRGLMGRGERQQTTSTRNLNLASRGGDPRGRPEGRWDRAHETPETQVQRGGGNYTGKKPWKRRLLSSDAFVNCGFELSLV